jgi:Guanylate kinase
VLYALCGVSFAGKTTIVNTLLALEPRLQQLITTTTRAPRPGEVDRRDYRFVSEEQFRTGQWVCPMLHRGAWYGIASQDLATCTFLNKVAALRPDKLGAIQRLVPTISFFLIRPDQVGSLAPDDQLILMYQQACTYQIINYPGQLARTISEIRTKLFLQEVSLGNI